MAVSHLALVDALARTGADRIPRHHTPVPKLAIEVALSSPFHSGSLSPVSSRGPSPAPSLAPSFHTAHSIDIISQRRPSPSPITIPTATVDEPLFSAYPISPLIDNEPLSPLKRTHLTAPPATSFSSAPWSLGRPTIPSRQTPRSAGPTAGHSWERRPSATNDDRTASSSRRSHGAHHLRPQASMSSLERRRTTTAAVNVLKRDQQISSTFGERKTTFDPSTRRRASLSMDDNGIDRWREFGTMTTTAYDFLKEENSSYTLQSVSMVSGVRPLSPIPLASPPPRSSSLIHSKEALLRLSGLSISGDHLGRHIPDVDIDRFVAETTSDMNAAADAVSFVSEPLTSSPSVMTKSLPPSTKTSLSRSARSGKESSAGGADHAIDDTEAIQDDTSGDHKDNKRAAKERVLIEKRRMILLEIVETEITYVHDLQALVHIYLPQLAALPSVSERILSLVVRNTTDLLQFHVQFAAHLVDILKYCGMGYEEAPADTVDTVTKRVSELFVREVTSFSLYNDYCAGSTAVGPLLRSISHRADYDAFEQRCQYVASTTANPTLRDLLHNRAPRPMRSRLRFQDILISPVQRVCRYPLLLAALLADVNQSLPPSEATSAVGHAQAIMRAVAANADDARQYKDAELKTISIADRLEPHAALSDEFMEHLGICRLGGALDVLYHHPHYAPLEAAVKVKYLAAFLYRGYLVLAKIRRGNRFEPKHYLPLEAFELIDITEGFLPHSIRLTIGDHSFDLAASCDAEKEVWANELVAARNESIVPPFELPSSINLFGPPTRRTVVAASTDGPDKPLTPEVVVESNKRHTVMGLALDGQFSSCDNSPSDAPATAPGSEYRRSQPATLLLRRASASQRTQVDRALSDIFFESLATARSKVQLQYTTNTSESRRASSLFDTPMLRRRMSFADGSRTSLDVLAAPEVRGAVMPTRIRSRPRTMFSMDGGLDVESYGDISRNTSFSSISDIPLRGRRSSLSLRRGFDLGMTTTRAHRRQSASISSLNLDGWNRARSVPNSPAIGSMAKIETVAEPEELGEIVENLTSPPPTAKPRLPKRMSSDESFVYVPDAVPMPLTTIVSPSKGSPPRGGGSGTIKRSMSFFARRSPSVPSLNDMSEESESGRSSSRMSTAARLSNKSSQKSLSKYRTAPSTPVESPISPKRRRSLRLFGNLRGFTPI